MFMICQVNFSNHSSWRFFKKLIFYYFFFLVLDLTDTIYGPGLAYPYLFDNNTGVAQQGSFTYPAGSGPVVFVRLASLFNLFSLIHT